MRRFCQLIAGGAAALIGISVGCSGTASAADAVVRSDSVSGSVTSTDGSVLVQIRSQYGAYTECTSWGELAGDTSHRPAFGSPDITYTTVDARDFSWADVAEGTYDVYWVCSNTYGSPTYYWGSDHRKTMSFPSPSTRVTVTHPLDPGEIGFGSVTFGSAA